MRTIGRVKVVKNREWNEWVVKAWDTEGKRYADADYYTTDLEDATGTARLMLNPKPRNLEKDS